MIPTAPPICRCPKCGGWMTPRVLEPLEWSTVAIDCRACGWDMELLGGQWVSITRLPMETPA